MSEIISKIKSKYILQMIFSHINYNKLLKITKNNKNIQKKLGLNIDLFQNWSNYQYCEKTLIFDTRIIYDYLGETCASLFAGICSIIFFIYILIFASIVAAKGSFNGNNTKNNYNKNYPKIIDKINYSLFGFLAYILISYIIIFAGFIFDYEIDYGFKKLIKKILLIFFGIIYIFYEVLIIFKLYLSYKIKKDKITWFMICDYILIILIFLYIAIIITTISCYFYYAGKNVMKRKRTLLTKFRDVKIHDFALPNDFKNLNKKEKKKYILDNKNKYKINISKCQEKIIHSINNFRKNNNIDELIYDKEISFGDLIIDKYSEPIILKDQNIFKLSDTNYLFKYTVGVFIKEFNAKKLDIINILLKDNLEKIIIIERNNIEFINIFKQQRIQRSIFIYNHLEPHSEDMRLEFREFGKTIYSNSEYFES